MPKVSIVVPAYNATQYLRQCLDSLAAQTLHDIEILCVNDGSKDDTSAIMHEYAERDSRFVVIDKPNSGYGVNINMGFARATGEYVGILESDDFAEPDMYETLYTMAHDNDLDIARGQFWLYWSKPEPHDCPWYLLHDDECGRVFAPEDPALAPEDPARHVIFIQPAIWSGIYKTSFIRENGLRLLETPGASYQDTAFNFKLWACAQRIMLTTQHFVHYRQDNEASSINNPGKVFTICGEYEEVERWLTHDRPDLKESLAPVAARMRFDAYTWNFGRVAPELKCGFAQRFHEDFVALRDAGALYRPLYSGVEWKNIQLVVKSADAYMKRNAVPVDELGLFRKFLHKAQTALAMVQYGK